MKKFYAVFAAALVALAVGLVPPVFAGGWKASATSFSQTSLLASYSFDAGVLTDSSGSGFTLTQTGSGITFPATGRFLDCALFTGSSSDYLGRNATDDASLDFGTGAFTISLWVRWGMGLAVSSSEQVLIEKFTGASGPGWTVYKKNGTTSLECFFDGTSDVTLTAPANLVVDGKWHQVVVTRSTTTWTIYYDGQQAATTTVTNTISDTSKPLLIGKRDGGTSPFYGSMDAITIWGRAWSATEVTTSYNNGRGQDTGYTWIADR